MKTKGGINRRMNHRYMIGSLAAAGASSAGAATVQITFANNYVANTAAGGLANFNPDLTGDGVGDGMQGYFGVIRAAVLWTGYDRLGVAGIYRDIYVVGGIQYYVASVVPLGSVRVSVAGSDLTGAVRRALPFFSFSDSRVNGGMATWGWLDMTARSGLGGQEVRINRLIFDDASALAPDVSLLISYPEFVAVPEPSSLGLPALGAGGLLARRRREKVAA